MLYHHPQDSVISDEKLTIFNVVHVYIMCLFFPLLSKFFFLWFFSKLAKMFLDMFFFLLSYLGITEISISESQYFYRNLGKCRPLFPQRYSSALVSLFFPSETPTIYTLD